MLPDGLALDDWGNPDAFCGVTQIVWGCDPDSLSTPPTENNLQATPNCKTEPGSMNGSSKNSDAKNSEKSQAMNVTTAPSNNVLNNQSSPDPVAPAAKNLELGPKTETGPMTSTDDGSNDEKFAERLKATISQRYQAKRMTLTVLSLMPKLMC
jgi:hypothetical protein